MSQRHKERPLLTASVFIIGFIIVGILISMAMYIPAERLWIAFLGIVIVSMLMVGYETRRRYCR